MYTYAITHTRVGSVWYTHTYAHTWPGTHDRYVRCTFEQGEMSLS
jgi:hypothetical protein